ncbi:trans-aconitate 2-methyltransferase [Salinisphaera aquimarina]|uniref:Trans-aconitate 2-methyltransferase n=1 Tax=Salinisphaera aquimarina TaxID=2094031 RepID=A0ABV7EQ60_9GAMM
MSWSAAQYRRFEDERNRPIGDLLARVAERDVTRVADLGCGPGNSTELLQGRFPQASVTAIDSSPDMIAAARRRLPDVAFELGDIATWADTGPFDLILSNAALHWVPDHAVLLPRLIDSLAPGGQLAVQMPHNLDAPTHRLMRELAAQAPWAEALAGAADTRAPQHDAAWYYRTLRPLTTRLDIWLTVYHHPLADGLDGIVEWFKGSALRPFLDRLDARQAELFLARYRSALESTYTPFPDGSLLLPFPRLFIVATR